MAFWEEKTLAQMTHEEWESLCDGCGKCCLIKLEDEETAEVFYTDVACELLNLDNCRCQDYSNRKQRVPSYLTLKLDNMSETHWLPSTCAYRLRAAGQPLPDWHYLVSGSRETVHEAGVSIRGRAISDEYVHPDGYDEHIVHWVD